MNSVHRTYPAPYSRLRTALSLLVCGWLMLVQPGLSYYWLIDSQIHAEIDAEEYGQTLDGHTLPGHAPHAPHQHPASQGIVVDAPVLADPFGAAFHSTVTAPARAPTLCSQCLNLAVYATSIALAPPERPPRGCAFLTQQLCPNNRNRVRT